MSGRFSSALQTVYALTRRDLLSNLRGWGTYVAIFVSFLASSFLLKNYVEAIKEKDILISSDPLNFPLLISLVVISFYLAVISVVSISRERDQGTLEVLFYGNVDSLSYMAAKFLADLVIYLLVICLLVLYFIAVSMLTNLALSWNLVKAVFLSIFSMSCVISFSLFISSLTSKTRTSIVWLVALLSVFVAIQVSHTMLTRLDQAALSPSQQYLRAALGVLFKGTEWISPFSYLKRGMESIHVESARLYGLNLLYSLAYSAAFMVAAVLALERKGVRG
ncbi:MAG: ABC transporter permease subunit [Deltaproteobacteria bacterium]|nr:ABC transporter permease subunit [Deltaproteobacteria bacterium]